MQHTGCVTGLGNAADRVKAHVTGLGNAAYRLCYRTGQCSIQVVLQDWVVQHTGCVTGLGNAADRVKAHVQHVDRIATRD